MKYTYNQERANVNTLDPELQSINPICLDILFRRGFRTSEEIREVLFPKYETILQPLKCQDIDRALEVLSDAVQNKKTIVVYRDYDVDGISAGAIAVESLRMLGCKVHHYANERDVDGFGICKNGIDQIQKRWPETKVILTVDNGITGVEPIKYANARGLTVVVTDHHMPGQELPPAAAIVDLKRIDETYPYHDLCGAGLAFRVMLELYRRLKKDLAPVLDLIDIAALATIADIVPLTGENRVIVREGMQVINCANRPFFKAMAKVFDMTEVTAHNTIAYYYAPALNALSRLGEDTGTAVEALLSKNDELAERYALNFQQVNNARKEESKRQYEIAESLIPEGFNEPAIVITHPDFTDGIIGITAGKLKEKFHRPVIVFGAEHNGVLKGSGRSIDAFPLKDNLDKLSELLLGYGGHTKAAGLSINVSQFNTFKNAFIQMAKDSIDENAIQEEIPLDAVLDENELTEQLICDLHMLEPFGEGFGEPLFGLRAKCDGVRFMGTEGQHVKYTSSTTGLSIIKWGGAEEAKARKSMPKKFIGRPSLNAWNGNISVQFICSER